MSTRTSSTTAAQAAHELRVVVGRVRRRLVELADNQDLTPSQLSVLNRLNRDGDATASDLARAERVRPQSVAATLGVLEERDLVVRRRDPDDGRRQLVALTEEGRQVTSGRRRFSEEWLTRAMQERFTESERATIIEAMGLLERVTVE